MFKTLTITVSPVKNNNRIFPTHVTRCLPRRSKNIKLIIQRTEHKINSYLTVVCIPKLEGDEPTPIKICPGKQPPHKGNRVGNDFLKYFISMFTDRACRVFVIVTASHPKFSRGKSSIIFVSEGTGRIFRTAGCRRGETRKEDVLS